MEKYILSVTVQNNAGVLARVSSLFGRRGYNIDSLTVSATTDPKVSCMSIIVQGDHMVLEQIMKQLAKLEEVMHVVHSKKTAPAAVSWCSSSYAGRERSKNDIRQLCDLYGRARGRYAGERNDHRAFRSAEPHRCLPRRHLEL